MITLNELPAVKKSGWPWTESSSPPSLSMPDGSPWPKISIITPSYNQVHYIEEAIRSVLLQNYPNLEYIIIDGGSTDGSVEIIKKYEHWLSFWISEPDRGQGHAINKGFGIASGDIAGWLSSDDIYYPGTLHKVANLWHSAQHPYSIITGTKLKGSTSLDQVIREQQSPYTLQHLLERCILEQPATFFPLDLFRKVDGINEEYFMALDYDLWLRMTRQGAGIIFSGLDFAITRTHSHSKSINFQRRSIYESIKTVWENYRIIPDTWLKKIITSLIVPQRTKSRNLIRFFTVIRNILFFMVSLIFRLANLSHLNEKKQIRFQ